MWLCDRCGCNAAGDAESQEGEREALLQQQKQQQQQQQEAIQLDGEISYNEALIEERDEGISHIQHSIDDIHQMTMVRYPCTCDRALFELQLRVTQWQLMGLSHKSCFSSCLVIATHDAIV